MPRRLHTSGSIKGGQSPMFPSSFSSSFCKKGAIFELVEPSFPSLSSSLSRLHTSSSIKDGQSSMFLSSFSTSFRKKGATFESAMFPSSSFHKKGVSFEPAEPSFPSLSSSTSLNCRLRTSGNIDGGYSPMFPSSSSCSARKAPPLSSPCSPPPPPPPPRKAPPLSPLSPP